MSRKNKFIFSSALAFTWMMLAFVLALPWIRDLGEAISIPLALLVIAGLSLVPGYLAAFLLSSIILDEPETLPAPSKSHYAWPGISVIIAARNEEDSIAATIRHLRKSSYLGELEIIVINDGSTDQTAQRAGAFSGVEVIQSPGLGKPGALNLGLKSCSYEMVLSLDADTLVTPQAIERLVSRMEKESATAVAGSLLVLNPRDGLLTRMQQWDYQMGIASIKRSQSLWQNISVAQGAFSLYRKQELLRSGGWMDMVGEDIVLTWSLLAKDHCIDFEPTAIAFTRAPNNLSGFIRQRSRWARGMIEGLRTHGRDILKQKQTSSHGVAINFLFPLVDASYALAFIPGVFLALAGNYAIVGPITLLVLPLNIIVFSVMYYLQRSVFQEVGLRLQRNVFGFWAYLLFYQALLAPISLLGYAEEALGRKKHWRQSK